MPKYELLIESPRPYFAEIPYALWGTVSYDSDGDCCRPTDRNWTTLGLTNRESQEQVVITKTGDEFEIDSTQEHLAARTATYLMNSCSARIIGEEPYENIGDWSLSDAQKRTERVRLEFPRPELKPFDSNLFWGSWKWVGWYASEFTWVGRWIMNSLLVRDSRAVFLCIQWLKQPPIHPDQNAALRYALELLTGKVFRMDRDWINWYDGNLFQTAGKQIYPEPDFQVVG